MIKWLMNSIDNAVDENILGNVKRNSDVIKLLAPRVLGRVIPKEKGKVKLVGGGGSGHEGSAGGMRMLKGGGDLMICGDIFAAPTGIKMFEAIKLIDDGSPILHNVQNHAGDVMNARICEQLAKTAGMDYHQFIFWDDIASAPKEQESERRGLVGGIFSGRIVGAAAELGRSIDDVIRLSTKCRSRTRSYGITMDGCMDPRTGKPMLIVPDDIVEMGSGVHGEGGAGAGPMRTSKEFAKIMIDALLDDMPVDKGGVICLLVNGAGGMTGMELNIFYNDVYDYATGTKKLIIYAGICGNMGCTFNTRGFAVSICVLDDEMKKLWDTVF
jgi:dihydroxyacetone kinase